MYLGKRIRIAIVDNDRLTLGVMKMMIERILPQANVCWAVSDGLTAVSKSLARGRVLMYCLWICL